MIALLDTSDTLAECHTDFGGTVEVGQLITPLTRRRNLGARFAIDNGAFARFDHGSFVRLLERNVEHRDRCIFVAAPDVVGCGSRTLDLFAAWTPRLTGWPVALVGQDGIEAWPLPWDSFVALFIGGTTAWKTSAAARRLGEEAKRRGKWLHVGRLNGPERFDAWADIADSFDGTGVARYSHMRRNLLRGAPLLGDARP